MSHGPNVRLRGVVHDARTRRSGRTECGLRFVLHGSIAREWNIALAGETTDEIDCMACIAAGVQ